MSVEFIKAKTSDGVYSVSGARGSVVVTLTSTTDPNYRFTLLRNEFELICAGKSSNFEVVGAPAATDDEPWPDISVARPTTPGTKFERAVAICKTMPGATRQQLIAVFVEQLGMTPAGASTYASTARKAAS